MTEEELNYAYQNRMSLPPAERAAIEKAHAAMVQRKNRERGLPNPPDNVDANLDAAATPVTPDPSLKPKAAPPAARRESPREDYEARLVAAGYTADEARRLADYEARQVGAFNPAFTSDETLRAGARYMRDQQRRLGMFESDMDLAYGQTRPRSSQPQELVPHAGWSDNLDGLPNDPRSFEAPPELRGIKGPETDDGRPRRPARTFRGAKEAQEYKIRHTNPETGELMPSQYDLDMRDLGYLPVFSQDGSISYSLAAPPGQTGAGITAKPAGDSPDESGAGPNSDWDSVYPRYQRRARAIEARPTWEPQTVATPFGDRSVLRLSAEGKAKEAERKAEQMIRVLSDRAGVPVAPDWKYDPAKLNEEAAQLRRMAANRRADRATEARDIVTRRRQAERNPLEYMGRDDIGDWQRMAAAEAFLRSPQEMTPLGVDAVGAANAMRNFNFEALSGMNPMRERLQEAQMQAAEAALPPEQRVAISIQRGEPMGTGGSATHVGARYKYWMLDDGPSTTEERERGFRAEMEGLGYKPEQIDAFLDGRRPKPAATPSMPSPPGPARDDMVTPSGR